MTHTPEEEDLLRLAANHRPPRGPMAIAEVLSRLMTRQGYANLLVADEWTELWGSVAGKQAEHCRVGKCSRGVLEIVVRNSTVLQELTFRKKQLLAAIQQRAPQFKVKDLRFRVGVIN